MESLFAPSDGKPATDSRNLRKRVRTTLGRSFFICTAKFPGPGAKGERARGKFPQTAHWGWKSAPALPWSPTRIPGGCAAGGCRSGRSSILGYMKADIHPEYVIANVHCSCGNQFYTRSTKADLHVELCSACHPFYTGKQKLVDTGGRVERFQRRAAKRAKANAGQQ